MIRLGLPLLGGRHWTGGRNYLLNLLRVVERFSPGQIWPVLLVDASASDDELSEFRALSYIEIVRCGISYSSRLSRWALALMVGREPTVAKVVSDARLDVIFENADYSGWRPGVAVLAWIPDLQHRNVPQLFSRVDWWRREIGFRMQARSPRVVMLSSETARQECERFYPASRGRTTVVRFAVMPSAPPPASADVLARHALPPKFIFLPNQFWKHKNHLLVLEALALLRARVPDIVVAATGNPSDIRHPGHFESLRRHHAQLELGDRFRFLGLVPYGDVQALMHQCAFLLNPSLSEGWSTTVEEAKSLGVPLVLSDLAVHREQADEAATYFDPGSPASAAAAIEKAWLMLPATAAADRADHARPLALARTRRFAEDFVAAVRLAIQRR